MKKPVTCQTNILELHICVHDVISIGAVVSLHGRNVGIKNANEHKIGGDLSSHERGNWYAVEFAVTSIWMFARVWRNVMKYEKKW
jgi:hypothetical protein